MYVSDLKSYNLPINEDGDQDDDQEPENKQDREEEYQIKQPEDSIEDATVTYSSTAEMQSAEQLRPQRVSRKPIYLANYYLN